MYYSLEVTCTTLLTTQVKWGKFYYAFRAEECLSLVAPPCPWWDVWEAFQHTLFSWAVFINNPGILIMETSALILFKQV